MIELLAVIGIIVLVSGVVLANNSRFGGVVILENLAYDVALSVRQAQVYGISVARFGTGTFDAGYGISIDRASPTSYVLFADAVQVNGLYDCSSPGLGTCELVQASTLNQGYSVSDVCVTSATGVEQCGKSRVDILFKRPEPDAWISIDSASCTQTLSLCAASARVVLQSPRGDLMSVIVDANGQISVRKGGS